ncbi:integrase [Archaeoglobus sp.]
MKKKRPGRDLNPGRGLDSALIDYRKVKREFIKYLEQKKLHPDTAQRYIHYLDKYLTKPIRSQEDVFEIMNSCERGYNWLARSIRNLINFYVEVKGLDETVAEKLKKACKMKPTGVRAIFISDNEIVEAWENHVINQPDDIRILFKLLVYSGVRASHAVPLLNTFDRSQLIEIEEKGIARYPILEFSKGQKRGYFAYIPLEFAREELRRIKISYRDYTERARYKRVSANTIRKWHYNFMIENEVPESVADFIQGRKPASVGAMHYLAVARQADRLYSRLVNEFPI